MQSNSYAMHEQLQQQQQLQYQMPSPAPAQQPMMMMQSQPKQQGNRFSASGINYYDPNLDVLTPCSDIAMVNAHQASYASNRSAHFSDVSSYTIHDSAGYIDSNTTAYDTIDLIKNAYPSMVMSTASNDVSGMDDDDDDDGDSVIDATSAGYLGDSMASSDDGDSIIDAASLRSREVDIDEMSDLGDFHDSNVQDFGATAISGLGGVYSPTFSAVSRATGSEYEIDGRSPSDRSERDASSVFDDRDDEIYRKSSEVWGSEFYDSGHKLT